MWLAQLRKMVRSRIAALAVGLALSLVGGAAFSGRPTLRRCHLVARLRPRLAPQTLHNARATLPLIVAKQRQGNEVTVGHGTGFLVCEADATGRALIMTNEHVVADARGQFAAIPSDNGVVRGQTRVVASSKTLDYALLEVALPAGAGICPVTLARSPKPKDVYCIGYPSVHQLPPARLGGNPRAWQRATARVRAPRDVHPMMAAADALGHAPQLIALGRDAQATVAEASREDNTAYFDLPGGPGASGSPVFSRTTHKAVGLLYGASPTAKGDMAAAVTPMHLILTDLRKQLPALPPGDRQQVQRLLGATR